MKREDETNSWLLVPFQSCYLHSLAPSPAEVNSRQRTIITAGTNSFPQFNTYLLGLWPDSSRLVTLPQGVVRARACESDHDDRTSAHPDWAHPGLWRRGVCVGIYATVGGTGTPGAVDVSLLSHRASLSPVVPTGPETTKKGFWTGWSTVRWTEATSQGPGPSCVKSEVELPPPPPPPYHAPSKSYGFCGR